MVVVHDHQMEVSMMVRYYEYDHHTRFTSNRLAFVQLSALRRARAVGCPRRPSECWVRAPFYGFILVYKPKAV